MRKAAKEYGTAKRLEGVFEPGQRVCVVEDVVTSGGALLSAVEALREANLDVSAAICVVDREEGGAEAIAAGGRRISCAVHQFAARHRERLEIRLDKRIVAVRYPW